MKTRIYNPIVIVALSFLSLNISAQNTKSVNVSVKQEKNLMAMAEKRIAIKVVKEDLDDQLSKLAEYIKFTPKKVEVESNEMAEVDWSAISEQLKKDVKYTPNNELLLKYEQEMLAEEIINELKPMVKFNPSESTLIKQYELESVFSETLKELETIVKYKPTAIQ